MSGTRTVDVKFKPRARLLLLLGDQLIRDAQIAVFELVKNAYDADAAYAKVSMSHVDDPAKGTITVEDNGIGMDYTTVTEVWLEPGTDYRLRQRTEGGASLGRVPIGEKGVGRFAAHKLGHHIQLITRKRNSQEVVVAVDWERDFKDKKYLSDVTIKVVERDPVIFRGKASGTSVQITRLREQWNRGMARDLARSVNAICSPFDRRGDFHAELALTGNAEWLDGLLRTQDVLRFALFTAHCELRGRRMSYTYTFNPFPSMAKRLKRRVIRHTVTLVSDDLEEHHIGPVDLDLYIFDRDAKILALSEVGDKKGLKEFLDESGGIRVYRDGIRVYDYGERGNDWLYLGVRRVNVPTKRISNNIVIGAVSLRLAKSMNLETGRGLIEKTNREGFVENEDFKTFREAIVSAITHIEAERNIDKTHIRNAYEGKSSREPVLADLNGLREAAERKRVIRDLEPYIERIERDFVAIRDKFLTSASAGLSLSVVIHEVEKGVAELVRAVESDKASARIKHLAKHLATLVEGYGALVRRTGVSRERASSLIAQALFNTELRLKMHQVAVENQARNDDFVAKCSRRLIVSTLMNLIDNSIWWLDNKFGREKGKRIYIGTTRELRGGAAIVIADNGPGFLDPPDYLVEPFISRKPDGMGLGLHIADQVMKVIGGSLQFLDKGDISLPKGFDGAIVALVFRSAGQ